MNLLAYEYQYIEIIFNQFNILLITDNYGKLIFCTAVF